MKRLLLLLFFWSVCARAMGVETYRFSHIRTGRESSNLEITSIYRDSDGFVWFGTSKGLLRYNGMEINASWNKDETSLLSDFISSIQEDAEGRLWVLVNDTSYVIYDRRTKRSEEDVARVLGDLTGRAIVPRLVHIDDARNMWIADSTDLWLYRESTRRTNRIERPGGMHVEQISAVERRDELCYLLSFSGAVEVIDASRESLFDKIPPPIKNNESRYRHIFVDSHHHVWITDHTDGVWRFDSEKRKWDHYGKDTDHPISHNSVRDLMEDETGRIWIATDHGGIDILNCRTGAVTALSHDPFDRTSLASNSVYSLYRDNENNIWVGYYKRGVSLYCKVRQKYFTQHVRSLISRSQQDDISVICEDLEGNLWFGTDEFGVVRLDRTTGRETYFRSGSGEQSLGSDVVVCLCCDSQGRVWIGTYQGGLSCYENGRLRRYVHREDDPQSLASNNVWALDEDCDGNIWIGLLDGGVQRLDPRTGRFDHYTAQSGHLTSDYVLDMSCRRGDVIWISTVNGIERLDVRTLARKVLIGAGSSKHMNILRDSRGLLWIVGRRGGVLVYDTRKEQWVESLGELREGLNVRSVVEDNNKNMWMATDNGLYNVVMSSDPRSGKYAVATYCYKRQEDDPLLDGSYNVRSAVCTRAGEILFGSVNGYHIVDPESPDLNRPNARARVVFTSLRINNTDIRVGMPYDGRVVLDRGIEFTDRIDLRYRQNRFTLEFSPLDYASPFRSEYFYRLEGFSDDWIPVTGERNDLSFTNLSPGEYDLSIRSLDSDGSLPSDAARLKIVIHPPFWRTTAAYLILTLLLLLAGWGMLRLFFRHQRRKLELQRAEMETERQNQLNEMKIRFFTNISHDFRTPLSLIITPLEELRTRCNKELRPSLDIIHRNALRLLHLVNQLLDFRKLDVYGTTLNLSHGDFIAFVREICSSFELLAENAHITLAVESSIEELEMAFDKDKMSKVFMNLLSNAFKYTHGTGRVTVTIARQGDRENELVRVSVADTGVGIPDVDKPHIFDRFYQVANDEQRPGSGIGLHIVREFIALHGGSISVRDNDPQGSVFYFVIPVMQSATTASEPDPAGELPVAENLPNGRPSILLVEDNLDFRTFLRECLSADNDIVEAADGVEALEVLAARSVDIVVSDVTMPRMDGLELCRSIKSNIATSHIPIILLTARTMQEHELEGLGAGADDYITKPFNLSILRLRISKLIEWNKRSHELFRKTPSINPSEITITSLDEKLIANALKAVEENMDNSEFSVEDLSAQLGMHRTHLYKKLTYITGKSPLEFIRIVRLKRAAQLLDKSQMNVSEVAYMVGFNSPKIFARYFREEYGVSPRDYVRNIEQKQHGDSDESD